jgi:thiamine transport system ATP-binding protein
MRGDPPDRVTARARELLQLVGLEGFEHRSVGTLSGGERQRVALARALAPAPRVLLLDEPLGSLDRRLRDRLLDDLERLFEEVAVTAVYVTHDQTEAFALGDRVGVMRGGRLVQLATPDGLWSHPRDADIARFLGIGNVDHNAAVRPEAVSVRLAGGAGDGVVERAVRAGPVVRLVLRLDDGRRLEALSTSLGHPVAGDRVDVEVDPAGIIQLR